MIDAKKLLDQFLGASAGGRMGGMLGDLQRRGAETGGGVGKQAGDVFGNLQRHATENPLAASVIGGGLAAILLGSKGRGLTGSAVKLGGLGLIGSLAYKAYQDYQAKQAGAAPSTTASARPAELAPPADPAFAPGGREGDDRARLLVTAMIAAAKADGHIDAAEQQRIFDRMGSVDLDSESKAFLMDQFRAPLDVDALARAAAGRPEIATEIYAASLLAIDADHVAERGYLQMLSARLGLSPELVTEIEATANAARGAEAQGQSA